MSPPSAAARLFKKKFDDVQALFDSGDIAGCISAAKENVCDTTLPVFYFIRYCILLARAVDNWDEGNEWKLAAVISPVYRLDARHTLTSTVAIQERACSRAFLRARETNDTNSLFFLQGLRGKIDELARQRDRDLQEHMLEQKGEDNEDETDSEADGVELDDSEEEAEMEAEGVKLGEGNALIVDGGDTQLLPIRGNQASTASPVPVIEALVMGAVPVGEDKEDNEGREEVTAGDEEGEEGGAGKMPGGGEPASTGDDGQLQGRAGVDREDERSAGIAAVRFLFDCQSYMPEHMRVEFNQAIQTFQELEVEMRSIVSTASAAPTSSTAASRINLLEQFRVAMVDWFQSKETSSFTADELVATTLDEWQGFNPDIQAAFGRNEIVSFCRELDGKDGFRYYKFGVLSYKP
ncbi:hypothetical protein J4E93_006964 [Alternaria ventricosa]|uniref:uncharacterized protein n=1 Tax=Alternaria ventricosa TaxID=1187951 RepID=UPI0020C3B809|nr:uncharacterized protein J4E93_006964 [Alternaria ventricosa]KAI4642895.1 hypothetical protein J4E93_006964 [Alternaria ventricosa]